MAGEEEQVTTGRDDKGRFLPGTIPNPTGRPKGSISPITRVREIFKEDPEGYELWVKSYIKDPANQKHIIEMLEGKPKQQVEHGGEAVLPFIINVGKYEKPGQERKQVSSPKELAEGGETAEANGAGEGGPN